MGVSIGTFCVFVLSSGALFVGVLSQGGNGDSPQRGGTDNQYGDRGQAGQGYDGQYQGGGTQYGQNGNGNRGQDVGMGQGNNQGSVPAGGQNGGSYANQYQRDGPARGQNENANGNNNSPAYGHGGNGYPNQNRGGPGTGNGSPGNRNGGPGIGNGGPAKGQLGGGNGAPSYTQAGSGGSSPYSGHPRPGQNDNGGSGQFSGNGQNGGQNDDSPGQRLSQLSPQLLSRMIVLSTGPKKSNSPTDANFHEEGPKPDDKEVHTKEIQCPHCKVITSLPIWVDLDLPTYTETKEEPGCGMASASAFTEQDESPLNLDGKFRKLTCEDNKKAVGVAWRYDQMEDPPNDTETKPEDLQYIRYLAMVCDEGTNCLPTLGEERIWTGNDSDLPHNASMCVPGDHLAGVDITYRGQLIFDVRARCCTSAIFPTCNMDFKQLLKRAHVGGTDLCDFCQPQKPTREELVFTETEENQWYTRDYRAALHRLFLRLLLAVEKSQWEMKVPILEPNSTKQDFVNAKILWQCPFNGTTLLPHDHLDFWVIGGKESNGCGLPVTQRVFVSEKHGIEYWSRTARAVMPNSNRAVTLLPQAIAWAMSDPCLDGC